jgi:hypothetical protein
MKRKLTTKLTLKKETVAHLGSKEMNGVAAGNEAQTGNRSFCICVYTDWCPTSVGILCEYTCIDCPTDGSAPIACCQEYK